MTTTDATVVVLVICLVFAVAIASYCLAKNEMLTEMYNDLVQRYNEERGCCNGND